MCGTFAKLRMRAFFFKVCVPEAGCVTALWWFRLKYAVTPNTVRIVFQEQQHMGEEDEDAAVAILLQLLDDLLIYDAGSLFEKEIPRPTKEDLEGLGQDENVVRILKVLRKYVRPRNEVLRIRRTVNAALAEGNVGNNNVYSRYLEAQQKLAALKDEKARLQEKLQSITSEPQNFADVRGAMMGEIYVQKLEKQLRVLKIYHKHLKLLHSEREQIDKQTTLVSLRRIP